jgi:hypothetical protein
LFKDRETHNAWHRKWRRDRINKGYCTRCQSRIPEKGYRRCAPCRLKGARDRNILRRRRGALGFCKSCYYFRPLPGHKRCAKCMSYASRRAYLRRVRVSQGYCTNCSHRIRVAGLSLCVTCLRKTRAIREGKRERRICVDCGKVSVNFIRCLSCRDKNKQAVLRWQSKNRDYCISRKREKHEVESLYRGRGSRGFR